MKRVILLYFFFSLIYIVYSQENNVTDSFSEVEKVIEDSFTIEKMPLLLETMSEYVTEEQDSSGYWVTVNIIFSGIFIVIFFYLLLIFGIPIFINIRTFILRFFQQRRQKNINFYKSFVFHFLSQEEVPEPKCLQKHIKKSALLSILYELVLYTSGKDAENLIKIYEKCKLEQYLLQKIKSPFVYNKSYYIKIFSTVKATPQATPLLKRLIHHRNTEIRLYAMQGLMFLNPESIVDLLKHYRYSLSLWEQINYYHFFTTKAIDIPDFHSLTLHKNDTMAMFAIRMVRVLHQKSESIKGYESLLSHSNFNVQVEMLRALSEFGYEDLSELLNNMMFKASSYIRHHIINNLARQKNTTVNVLMNYYDSADIDLKLEILNAIYNFVTGGKKAIVEFTNQTENKELQKLSSHLLNNVL